MWNFLKNWEQVYHIAQLHHSVAFTQRPPVHTPQRSLCRCAYVALFTIAELWYQPGCPTAGEWIKTTWYPCTMKFCPGEELSSIICWVIDRAGDHCLRKTNITYFLFVDPRFYVDKWSHICLRLESRSKTLERQRRQGRGAVRVESREWRHCAQCMVH